MDTEDARADKQMSEKSHTATAILNILQQFSISPPQTPSNTSMTLQHLHSLPKSIIPKRRLSSSSSFDGYSDKSRNNSISYNNNGTNHHNKKQLIYLRNSKGQVRSINLSSPLSRKQLIKRLNTFSVLNWTIQTPKLSPLVCATQGWKCHAVRKNEIHCTSCHSGIIVKLSEAEPKEVAFDINKMLNSTEKYEQSFDFRFLDDEDDADDDVHIYETLVNSYVNRLTTDHYPNCNFLPILPLTPKDENYYITSKDIPRELINFKNRLNVMINNKNKLMGENFKKSILSKDEMEFLLEYLKDVGNEVEKNQEEGNDEMEIDDEYQENEAERMILLDIILPALLGWELKIQKFSNDKFLLLKCDCCTKRILLGSIETVESTDNSRFNDGNVREGEESRGDKIEELKACPHKAEIPAKEEMTEFDETVKTFNMNDEEEEDEIDVEQEHDSWCCMRSGWRIVLEGLRSCADVKVVLGKCRGRGGGRGKCRPLGPAQQQQFGQQFGPKQKSALDELYAETVAQLRSV